MLQKLVAFCGRFEHFRSFSLARTRAFSFFLSRASKSFLFLSCVQELSLSLGGGGGGDGGGGDGGVRMTDVT